MPCFCETATIRSECRKSGYSDTSKGGSLPQTPCCLGESGLKTGKYSSTSRKLTLLRLHRVEGKAGRASLLEAGVWLPAAAASSFVWDANAPSSARWSRFSMPGTAAAGSAADTRVLDRMDAPSDAHCEVESFHLCRLSKSTSGSLSSRDSLRQLGLPLTKDALKNDERLVLLSAAAPKSLMIEELDAKVQSDSG